MTRLLTKGTLQLFFRKREACDYLEEEVSESEAHICKKIQSQSDFKE